MKKQDIYKQSLQFLESIRKQIDALGNSPNTALNICKEITEKVKTSDHIGIIVALYNNKYLQNLFKVIQTQYQQKKNDQIQKNISILYLCAYDCFFKHLPQFKSLFEFFRPKISKIVEYKTYKDFGGQNPRYQAMKQLLIKFASTNDKDKQNFQRGKDLNQFINTKLNVAQPTTAFQQCVYTYIRIKVQQIQAEIMKQLKQQQINFCCKLHFQEGGSRTNIQTRNQNFNKQFPAIPSKKILKEEDPKESIKKHVISYLNSTGGIYYLGIQHKLQKEAIFHGITITEKQKIQILNWVLNQVVMKVYPPDQEDQDQDQKQQQIRMENWRQIKLSYFSKSKDGFNTQYQINKYIFVDFINLYDAKTWFYSRQKEGTKYIIRIKVKLGDQYEVYHTINDKDIPQAYIRDDKKQKKLSVIQYYDQVYRRLKNKANQKSEQPPKTHSLCRFTFRQIYKK